jgi:hypothetical protein
MFWFWGLLAVGVLVTLLRRDGVRFVAVCLAFGAAALLPYSFLTYMPRVPSRHTYMASVALALVVGAALTHLAPRIKSGWMTALVTVIVLHNCIYLWTYKQRQFKERAMPTAALIDVLKSTSGPVVVECFPFPKSVAVQAATIAAGASPRRLIFRDSSDCTTWRLTPAAVTETAWENRGQ